MSSRKLYPHEQSRGFPLRLYAFFAKLLDPYRGAMRIRRYQEMRGIQYALKEQKAEIKNDQEFLQDFSRLFKDCPHALDALCTSITRRSTISSLQRTAAQRANLRIVTDAWKIIVSRRS